VGLGLTVVVVIGTALWACAVFSIYLRPHTRLAASRWIYDHVPEGATVANEHWDWGLPLRVDGHDPFGGMYNGLEMQNYNEDTLEKREQLFVWLDEADYIFLASNRLYASIARLPARYPLTTAYYRALFAGELGFELAADFTSRPAVGPFQFPDQECPYPLMEAQYEAQNGLFDPILVRLPPAEEAFSVYDHPRVLIFRKTADYSRQRVEQVLGDIDVTRALHGFSPREATAAPDLLEFDPETWADQQAGGTWSHMFNRDGLFNRYPGLAAVAWWSVVTGLGWLAFPLLFVALPRLHDRGYGFARTLALLLVAYLTWLAASLRVLPNTRGTIIRMVMLLALVGGGVGWFNRRSLGRFLRRRWRLILLSEALFAGLYVLWIGVRFLQPDLWHPVVGGEKPMVLAYLNAVMKSTWFPPYNPWFSGATINYYYFGFVIVGTLIKLMGTLPAIGYNLAVPLLAALTGVGAFSVAYNLFGGHRRGARLAGVMALVFTVLLGNLGVVQLIRTQLISLGGELFPSTVPGFSETVAMFRGLWRVVVQGAELSMRIESWYWHPTRIIPAAPGEVGPIAEFPAFTFLYGDLHAHMIAFPLVLLTLALAVHWASTSRPRWPSLLLGGLVVGALYPANTWNYPPCLILALAALAVGLWGARRSRGSWGSEVWAFAWRALLLVGLTRLLYLPYIRHYAAGYTSLEIWHGSRTPFDIYLWIHGVFLFPVLTRLLIEVGRAQGRGFRSSVPHSRLAFIVWLIGSASVTAVLVFLGYGVALIVVPVALLAAYLIFAPGTPANRRLLWLMVGQAMAIGLGVEVLVLKGDVGRMNTVFKFYLQAWMLLCVAAGVALAWVHEHTRRYISSGKRQVVDLLRLPTWRNLWWIGMGALILGGALFLPYGVRARAVDRMASQTGLTLDGMAFMEHAVVFDGAPGRESQEIPLDGDYAAIRWMQDNVEGSPVILEGLGHREYLWANRVSVYTGLPAVVGWRWHQVQQRLGVLPAATVDWRRNDVDECYSTADGARAREILARYGVGYVYVGAYERAYYDPIGLDKFERLAAQGLLRVAYDAQGVKIYEVTLPTD
jgi:YYY domain-containing protein